MAADKNVMDNKIFKVQELSYDASTLNEKEGSGIVSKATELMEDGSYRIRIGAPKAKEVTILPWFGDPTAEGYAPWRDKLITCTKNEDGIFECILPFSRNKTGPRNIEVYIDGTYVLWPYLPIYWSDGHPFNFLEVPDSALDFCYIENVPHGQIVQDFYWSAETNETERCIVYTPPGYMNGDDTYPVLYLQHGGFENETVWTDCGHVNLIMDNLLARKDCVPFLIVMNNGMVRYKNVPAPNYVDDCFENSLIHSCIPYIESHYRVKLGKWNRAIAGLSMGSMQTNDIGFKHPDIFGNMGSFTSTMYSTDFHTTYERPWPKVMSDPDKFMRDYKVFFCSATPQEDHIPFFRKDEEIMRKAGIEGKMPGYRRVVHDGRFIRWDSWRMGMREFATMLFR